MHVAVVGLGFGHAFVPIYLSHPLVSKVTACDPDPDARARVLAEFSSAHCGESLEAVLADPTIDAVHLLTPLPLHAEQTLQVVASGKHVAVAVTMGTCLQELGQIVDAVRSAGVNYMMMETGVYTREFLFAQDMVRSGALGNLTYLRGDYFQDLEAPYADYWRRVPPMHYATHALAPLLALAGASVDRVSCVGSGRLRRDICDDPANPFPMQTAQFVLADSPVVARVDRAWYQTARQYVESFSVYGDRGGFEWQQLEHEDPVVFELEPVQSEHRWRGCTGTRTPVPYRPELLPEPLRGFADGGHGGSHPHLVHEFVESIVQGRPSRINEAVAADWCAPGICAHQSSLSGGEWVAVPKFL
jgi:predicted dehydrogenase